MDTSHATATDYDTAVEEGWDFPNPATEARYADEDEAAREACVNCGDTTADGHQFNGNCFRIRAEQVPTPISKWDDR